jgi:putative membrane protein
MKHAKAMVIVAALALMATGGAWAAATGGKNAKADEQFLREAALGDMAEVQMGKLGEQKAVSPEVKEFGRRMQADHGAHLEQVRSLAAKEDVTLPKELDQKDRQNAEKLGKLNAHEFDRQYMSHMVKDHQEDIQKYEHAQKQPVSADVKALIDQTLPILKEHHAMAENIAKEAQARK